MVDQTINPPDLDDLLAEDRETIFSNINCVQIGRIENVNNDQTVSVQIQFLRRIPGGQTSRYPLLVDCPYIVWQGGDSFINMPIVAGNYCLVLFNDRNIDNWWDTGNIAVPSDTRKHSLSDGIAIIGLNPRPQALEYDSSNIRIVGPSAGGAFVNINADGSIDINAPAGLNITAETNVTGNTEITGMLTVSGLIRSAVDIIADYMGRAIAMLTHYHFGNLGRNTSIGEVSGGTGLPTNAPTMNADGEIIDGNGTNSTEHGHPYTWTDGPGSGTTGNAST